jgi:hypothetical protein
MTRVKDAGPHYSEGLSRVLESMPSGADDPAEAADWLKVVFDSGYAGGRLDGMRAKFEHVNAACATACASTVEARFEAVGRSQEQRDQLVKVANDCSRWKDPQYVGSTIPGASYGPGRLGIAQKVAGASRIAVTASMAAFETGYEAGLKDNYPPEAHEIDDAVLASCRSTARQMEKIAGTALDVDALCLRVRAEMAEAQAGAGMPTSK